ncbi:CDP-diacylglycerol--serine O-phosphatidyltransferase [Methylophilaceae bacterium]|nr:CDP-diacylglycerol--serine O-phosphatidyltransferase [Methylophilaceae bacterium]|tara:strand:- start:352 stop:1131 length:780 start_codon:yes stop_codon:yes gene_type:complete
MNNIDKIKQKNYLGKRSFYLLPNILTTSSLFAGFYSIVQAMNGAYDHAALAIFIALILDGLDGRVARLTNTQSSFGAEYDSLSDMVSFGVAPGLIVYVWALQPLGKLGWIAAFIYCTCAAFRLARFNVKLDIDNKQFFFGLPSPAAAALIASFIWISYDNGISGNEIFLGFFQMQWFAFLLTIFAALSMVTDLRYYSGKDINLRNSQPFIAILVIVMIFGLISHNPAEIIFIILMAYALSGYVMFFRNRYIRNMRKKDA